MLQLTPKEKNEAALRIMEATLGSILLYRRLPTLEANLDLSTCIIIEQSALPFI